MPEDKRARLQRETEFFMDTQLVRIRLVIEVVLAGQRAPWEFEVPFPGSLISTFRSEGSTLRPTPYTPYTTPYAPHPTPFTPHPTQHTLHTTPCRPHTTHHTPHPTHHILHPTHHTLHPTTYTLHTKPSTPQPTPYTCRSQSPDPPAETIKNITFLETKITTQMLDYY